MAKRTAKLVTTLFTSMYLVACAHSNQGGSVAVNAFAPHSDDATARPHPHEEHHRGHLTLTRPIR